MQCPSCQHHLVEIPTLEGPQLDVCPDQHGLWLDRGEVNLFVDNYQAVDQGSCVAAPTSVTAPRTTCPKCGGLLDRGTVLAAALFACRACKGWWLPQGSLTQLNATGRGGAAHVRVDEADFYRRAEKKAQSQIGEAARAGRHRHAPRMQQVWFWTVFLSTAVIVSALILVAGLRAIAAPGVGTMRLDATRISLACGALAGIGLSAYGFVVNNRKRLIEGIPTSAVRSLAIGLVEVSGRALPEKAPLRAPFSGLPCVLYSYAVEQRRGSDKETRWETIAKGSSEEPFYVQDDTGRVLVVPFDARLILPDRRTTRSNWLGTLPEQTILGLSKLGIAVDGWFGAKTIRCSESCILPDERVYVMGTAQEHRGVGVGIENSARLFIGSSRDNEFIISNRSETELLGRLQWQVWAFMGGGPALALVCLLLMFMLHGTGP